MADTSSPDRSPALLVATVVAALVGGLLAAQFWNVGLWIRALTLLVGAVVGVLVAYGVLTTAPARPQRTVAPPGPPAAFTGWPTPHSPPSHSPPTYGPPTHGPATYGPPANSPPRHSPPAYGPSTPRPAPPVPPARGGGWPHPAPHNTPATTPAPPTVPVPVRPEPERPPRQLVLPLTGARTQPVGDGYDPRRALIAQCPRCGEFRLDVTRAGAAYAFRCHNDSCANTWSWTPGTAWPAVVVRRNLTGPAPRGADDERRPM